MSTKYKNTVNPEVKDEIVFQLKALGFPNSAAYVEKYGMEDLNPSFWKLASKEADEFYKVCIEMKCQWRDILEFPEDAIF